MISLIVFLRVKQIRFISHCGARLIFRIAGSELGEYSDRPRGKKLIVCWNSINFDVPLPVEFPSANLNLDSAPLI